MNPGPIVSERKCIRLHISGRVQGVWYRGAMAEQADRLGICGWVRNLPDGRVEAVVEGDADVVDEITAWCRDGPAGARVTGVVVVEEEPGGDLTGFEISYRGS